MSRNRLIFTCLSVAMLLTMVLMACAPAAPAKPVTPPPAATPPPVVTPPATPPPAAIPPPVVTPPPPAAPAAPPKTSYDAKTYTNNDYGFIFLYPSSMNSATPKAKYNVFEAADAMQVPAVGVSVLDTAKMEAQTEESLKSTGGSDIKTVSSEPVTLADGKTKGTLTILGWKSTGYNITTYSMAVEKGDKTLSVSYTSLTDMIDAKIAKEVVNTLTLK